MVEAFTELRGRWQDLHQTSTLCFDRLALQIPSPAVDIATLQLPPALLVGVREAEAIQHAEAGAAISELAAFLEQHEVLLCKMHELLRSARGSVRDMTPAVAANRGSHGILRSPADLCSQLAAPLRAYEAELLMKHGCLRQLRPLMSAKEQHDILSAWGAQPSLDALESTQLGESQQKQLEADLRQRNRGAQE